VFIRLIDKFPGKWVIDEQLHTLIPIPAEPLEAPTTAIMKDADMASIPRRILVVDDNRFDSVPEYSLEMTGNQTHTAHDLEAVEAAKTFHPDAVLLDIGLPKQTDMKQSGLIRQEEWVKRVARRVDRLGSGSGSRKVSGSWF
jgi:PleD family two-component response regulator